MRLAPAVEKKLEKVEDAVERKALRRVEVAKAMKKLDPKIDLKKAGLTGPVKRAKKPSKSKSPRRKK